MPLPVPPQVGILNVGGFFDKLLEFLDHAAEEVGRGGGDGKRRRLPQVVRQCPAVWESPPPHPAHHTPPAQGFIRPSSRAILISAATPAELLDKLAAYQPPPSLIKLASEGKLGHQRG